MGLGADAPMALADRAWVKSILMKAMDAAGVGASLRVARLDAAAQTRQAA